MRQSKTKQADESVNWQQELAKDIASFSLNPLAYSLYAFPWGERGLTGHKGPRDWQRRIMLDIAAHLANPSKRFQPLQIAVAAGNGVGKSSLVSMLTSWALDTCEDARVTVTANTEPQLRTKTWPEITKWKELAITKPWWTIGATSIRSADAGHADHWRADMITWNEQNPAAFQGLHNVGKRILLVFDEASGIPEAIWDAAVGSLTDENTEIIWLAFGNPLQSTGAFHKCFGIRSHRWIHYNVDARTVEGTNKDLFKQLVDDYGEDSDIVRVRVRGEFPRVSSTQFLNQDTVYKARKFRSEGHQGLPRIMGVDVARFGDDRTVAIMRQGRMSRLLFKNHGLSTSETAEKVIELWQKEKPDAVVVDGDGLGAGVVDHLRYRGFGTGLYEFHGAEKPQDGAMYANRRAEVWGQMRDWLNEGAQIPDDPELEQELVSIQYGMNVRGQIQMEKKSDMKARGYASPDIADALALTFAVKVRARAKLGPKDAPRFGEYAWMT